MIKSIGLRVHAKINKPSLYIKPIKPADRFKFIGRRLEHILSKDTALALYITADPLPKTPHNCPAARLKSWRGQLLAEHVQKFLHTYKAGLAINKIDELLIIVEGGGLLGFRNRELLRVLQGFADLTGITTCLSHLPAGISRIYTDFLVEEDLQLKRDQWQLGTVRLQIGKVKASYSPTNPRDGNFRPTSWNRIFRSLTTPDTNDKQTTPSSNGIQDDTDSDRRDGAADS